MSRPIEHDAAGREIDPPTIPLLSLLLGVGPMLPIIAAGIVANLTGDWATRVLATVGGLGWASAILIFVAGVRRGYGFARAAVPRIPTIAATLGIFWCGALGLALCVGIPEVAVAILAIGYLTIAIADPLAARSGEAPRHFARLRPPQMATGLVGLALLANAVMRA